MRSNGDEKRFLSGEGFFDRRLDGDRGQRIVRFDRHGAEYMPALLVEAALSDFLNSLVRGNQFGG